MNGTTKIGLALLGLTLLLIGIIDAGRVQPIDWEHSYNQREKSPYGLYIARTELPTMLGGAVRAEDMSKSDNNYPDIRDFLAGKEKNSLVYIVRYFDASPEAVGELLAFAERGGEVFISANNFYSKLLDSLGVGMTHHYPPDFNKVFDFEDRPFALEDGTAAHYEDLEYPGLFHQLDGADVRIIGYFEEDGKQMPNFIEVKRGKGRFLLHLEPLMFTNYYMLQEDSYRYAAATLKLLQNDGLLWYDAHYRPEKARTPLRVLLRNDGLRQAWYVLLFALLLFLLFKSKRESRAVAVVRPEPNLSKEFAKTIATLYYEAGNPGNLVHKKIEHFLYGLRTQYRLDVLRLEEPEFAEQLAMRSGTDLADCQKLAALLTDCRRRRAFTDRELMTVNQTIEDFKNKANMP